MAFRIVLNWGKETGHLYDMTKSTSHIGCGLPSGRWQDLGKRLCLVEESPKEELGEGLSAANISRSWGPTIWVLERGGGIRISHLSVIYVYIRACMLSRFSRIWLFANPMDIHGILQARIWSALSFPFPGDLPDSGTEPMSLAFPALADGFFTTAPPGKPHMKWLGWDQI